MYMLKWALQLLELWWDILKKSVGDAPGCLDPFKSMVTTSMSHTTVVCLY